MVVTFVFFGVLVGATIGVVIANRRTPGPVDPTPIDSTWSSIEAFYANRPDRGDEVELGDRWTSAVDPGASFTLSWLSKTSELVALRQQAQPGERPEGRWPAVWDLDDRATGMKVLAVVDEVWVRECHPEDLRPLPDGLDQLTAKLGFPYEAPTVGAPAPSPDGDESAAG